MSAERAPVGRKITSVGLFGNPEKADLPPAIDVIIAACGAGGAKVTGSADLAGALPPGVPFLPNEELIGIVDVVIALGGDGTMLRAPPACSACRACPLLGVNLGSLGYLTDVPLDELEMRWTGCSPAITTSTAGRGSPAPSTAAGG